VYRTDCGCVEEKGACLSDGSKWLEENEDSVSDGLWMCRGERRQCIGRQ
jgi:hypothetical protein